MKHLKTCIAVSLDGFIATKDNELDWIPENVKKEISVAYEQRMYCLPELIPIPIFLNIGVDGRTKAKILL